MDADLGEEMPLYNSIVPMPVRYEALSGSIPSETGPYRVADYMALPDEPRCELLFGRLVVTPAPSPRHQLVIGALHLQFAEFAAARGGVAILSPVDVELAPDSMVQPDLVYISRERLSIVRRRIHGAPDLAIEVLSSSTARRDRLFKLDLYARSGVKEFWLVDPESETIDFLVNRDGVFEIHIPYEGLDRSAMHPGLELSPGSFWSSIPRFIDDGISPEAV